MRINCDIENVSLIERISAYWPLSAHPLPDELYIDTTGTGESNIYGARDGEYGTTTKVPRKLEQEFKGDIAQLIATKLATGLASGVEKRARWQADEDSHD